MVFILLLYDRKGKLKARGEYPTHLSATRSGENWKLLRKGNTSHITELEDHFLSQKNKKLQNIKHDIHMDYLLGGVI